MKKVSQLLKEFANAELVQVQPLAEGDVVVLKNGSVGEIVSIGPNYANVLSEGKIQKEWLTELKLHPGDDYIPQVETKNLSEAVIAKFQELAAEQTDRFGFYNCLLSCDNLMGATKEKIDENYVFYKNEFERATRYLKKFDIVIEELGPVEDMLLEKSLLEGLKFTPADKNKIAHIIGGTAGVELKGTPEEIINNACAVHKTNRKTNEAWTLLGKMLNHATKAGINWNKEIFHPATRKYMNIEDNK